MRLISSIKQYTSNTIHQAFRVGKMGFLVALGSAACLGTEKLLVIPFLLTIVEESKVGQFVWFLALSMIFGRFAAGGISDALLRLYAAAREDGIWSSLVRRGTIITILVSVSSVFVVGIFYMVLDTKAPMTEKLVMVIGLGIYLSLQSGRVVLNTFYRVKLQFGLIALCDFVAATGLLLAIPLSILLGMTGLPIAYVLSSLFGIGASIIILRKYLTQSETNLGDWNRRLLSSAPVFAVTSIMGVAYYQAGRVILGLFRPYSEVLVFFAAESIIAIVMMPMVYLAGVIYAYISRKEFVAENQQIILSQHIVCCLISTVAVYFIIKISGSYLLPIFFPDQAEAAWVLLKILAIGGAMKTLYMFSRGFIYKFSSYKNIIIFTTSSFALNVALLFSLTPIYGLKGTSWAVTLSNIYVSILWFGAYVWTFFVQSGRSISQVDLGLS